MASELKVDKIYNKSGDGDSGVVLSTNDVVATHIAGSEKVRVDASGNVGIGNTTPSSFYSLADNLVVGTGTGGHGITIYSGTDSSGYIGFNDTASNGMQGFIQYNHDGNYLAFGPNGSERMRIDSSGNVLIGATSTFDTQDNSNGSDNRFCFIPATSGLHLESANTSPLSLKRTSGNGTIVAINRGGYTGVGSISVTTSSTAFNTSSDYRLKENVVTDWDATSRLKQLKPSRFNFKVDKDTTVDGFLAHEVSSIVPEAIIGEKDAVDKDGKPEYQGIDQSKLVPLLVKTIQELEARITALEAK